MKIWFLRHQAGGIVWEFPFVDGPPSEEQISPIARLLEVRHGVGNAKGAYWLKTFAVDGIGQGAVPEVVIPGVGKVSLSETALPGAQLSGEGTVTPR